MKSERRKHVDEDGGELVKTVEHQTVLPHHYGHHQHPHAQDIVGLEPDQTVGEHQDLADDGDVHEVAEVKHEEVIIGLDIFKISARKYFDWF